MCPQEHIHFYFIEIRNYFLAFKIFSIVALSLAAYTFGRGVVDNVYETYIPESEN